MSAELQAGCWIDSHHGIYAMEIVQEIAAREGWTGAQARWATTPDDSDEVIEAADEAAKFLEALAPEGYWIGWEDGDFGMYPVEPEEDDA